MSRVGLAGAAAACIRNEADIGSHIFESGGAATPRRAGRRHGVHPSSAIFLFTRELIVYYTVCK